MWVRLKSIFFQQGNLRGEGEVRRITEDSLLGSLREEADICWVPAADRCFRQSLGSLPQPSSEMGISLLIAQVEKLGISECFKTRVTQQQRDRIGTGPPAVVCRW